MSETNFDTMFGRMAVDQGLVTEEDLKKIISELKAYREKNRAVSLRQLMVKRGLMTSDQAKRLKTYISESKSAAGQIPGYKVIGKLGAGAMAVVYKAKQLSLDRIVAIKVLPKRYSEKPNYIKRFYKEGKLAAKLNHNNIVQAIDVGEVGGLYYFVMEYVEGKTLYDDLSKGKIFDEGEALDIITQVARALEHAHAQGMIHRDVKPKNIMINSEGVVKLADMGLARETSDIKAAENERGKAFGTPYYIAPEQVRGELDIDGRADIYALGATLYHMVTGKVPFEAKTPSEVMKKHVTEPIVPPDHLNTSLSAGISEVIEVMMAKKKEERYTNVAELLVDLDAVKAGQPPVRAHDKFNLSDLSELEQEGEAVELEEGEERMYPASTVTGYKIAVTVLSLIIAILLVVILFMANK
ncbi:Serine/threonine-protein kinase PknB [Anaerohalosphaera lusitana]|uniref:non-specific serine/threonine protein kinase n=1 Tax=Anaerohalosphaera lusitana TaxID=1936003 RepID=A0A1U9NNN7_9BACT|nr:serine/threonine-protein kinase [Anaerohalosphaera lusitana]AQT69344.1 Serine/threonine-protein kinase PknB [Anaerohalosphaera lusitana]